MSTITINERRHDTSNVQSALERFIAAPDLRGATYDGRYAFSSSDKWARVTVPLGEGYSLTINTIQCWGQSDDLSLHHARFFLACNGQPPQALDSSLVALAKQLLERVNELLKEDSKRAAHQFRALKVDHTPSLIDRILAYKVPATEAITSPFAADVENCLTQTQNEKLEMFGRNIYTKRIDIEATGAYSGRVGAIELFAIQANDDEGNIRHHVTAKWHSILPGYTLNFGSIAMYNAFRLSRVPSDEKIAASIYEALRSATLLSQATS